MRHSISTKPLVIKGKVLNPPKGTQKEFASSKWLVLQGLANKKSSKKSIPGTGKPSPSTSKLTSIPPKQPSVTADDVEGPTSTNIPAVLVLRSPPPYGLCVHRHCPLQSY